jgi:hypothetical protein
VKNVVRAARNVAAFVVTVVIGIAVGTALFTVESVETIETDVKKRIERLRHPRP